MHDHTKKTKGTAAIQGQLFELAPHSQLELARWLLGALESERIRFGEAIGFARSTLSQRREAPTTRKKRLGIIDQFATFASASGVVHLDQLRSTHVDDFYWSATRRGGGSLRRAVPRTAANRQSLLKPVFALWTESGLWVGVDLAGPTITRAEGEQARPANEDELDLIRSFAEPGLGFTRRSAIIALRLAGGSAIDVAAVRAGDIDLEALTVTFGCRTNPLDEWSVQHLADLVTDMSPDALLCTTNASNPAHVVTVQTREVLIDAGLGGVAGLTPRSLELGAARIIFGDDIVGAARWLGSASLDGAARALCIDWQR
ncbi:MAG: hypothetical protein ACPHDT_15555 [Acidimicrobiales bacterium]